MSSSSINTGSLSPETCDQALAAINNISGLVEAADDAKENLQSDPRLNSYLARAVIEDTTHALQSLKTTLAIDRTHDEMKLAAEKSRAEAKQEKNEYQTLMRDNLAERARQEDQVSDLRKELTEAKNGRDNLLSKNETLKLDLSKLKQQHPSRARQADAAQLSPRPGPPKRPVSSPYGTRSASMLSEPSLMSPFQMTEQPSPSSEVEPEKALEPPITATSSRPTASTRRGGKQKRASGQSQMHDKSAIWEKVRFNQSVSEEVQNELGSFMRGHLSKLEPATQRQRFEVAASSGTRHCFTSSVRKVAANIGQETT